MIKYLIFLLLYGEGVNELRQPDEKPLISISCEIPKFTREALQQYLIDKGVCHPEIAYAQAVLETGDFTSNIFKENNNLFGMRLAKKRFTLATGENRGHAVYRNWQESVDDYILWQGQWKRTPIEKEWQYYKLLDKVYATDKNYVKVVKIVKRKNDFI
jgi:flagellum-specific peptidoglycan hydrolase FlgJ